MKVREATQRHNVAFVSSIRTYGNLGPFRPVNRADFKGIRLFDMVLRPNQVICGSTVKEGDPDGTLYGNWGVIIGDGDIQQAFPYDATSYVEKDRAMSPYAWRNEEIDVETQVSRAIEFRTGHNEVDIALGARGIAGLFFGNQPAGVDGVDLPSEEVLRMIQPLRLPIYELRQGQFYSTDTMGTVETSPTPPREIIKFQASIDPALTERIKDELTNRLYLPPRNSISAGWLAGRVQIKQPSPEFPEAMEGLLDSEFIDRRYYGSMAVFAAGLAELTDKAAFDEFAYREFVGRIDQGGMLAVDRDDIDYYLSTGSAPEYLGKI